VQKSDKERVVAELTERLRTSETLIVADYRGLTMPEIEGLRNRLLEHGAQFNVVKNTLGRIAAEAAGADQLLALLEGPTAVAFLDSEGDPVAVAKALGDVARTTKILTIRGGVMQGRSITAEDVEELAKLPPVDVLRGQVAGAILSPLYTIVGLFQAPLTNLVGLIDARIDQLREQGDTSDAETPTATDAAVTVEVSEDAAPAEDAGDSPATDGEGARAGGGDSPAPEDEPAAEPAAEAAAQPETPAADPTVSVEDAVSETGTADTQEEQ
jgi:large subunit ribosomal protein L10